MMQIGKTKISWQFIAILGAFLLVIWPLLHRGFFISDDGEWMTIRLTAFFQSLREGQFPVRFLGRLNNSYGYPVSNFLYPGFLYLGSILHLLGFSFVDAVKFIFIGSVAGSSVFLFYWLKRFFSAVAAFFGTISFIFSPYLLYDVYKRGSVGEVLANFAACLLVYLVEANILWAVPIGIALLVVGHNSLGLLFLIFILIYAFFRKRFSLLPLIILGIGMSTFFWFPALYEQKFVAFSSIVISHPEQYFLTGSQLFLLGFVNIIAFVVLLKQKKKSRLELFFLTLFSLVIVFSTSVSSLIWNIFPILGKLFQFPYRFVSLGFIAGPWLIARFAETYAKNLEFRPTIVLFALLWILPIIALQSQIQFVDRPEGYYTTNEGTTTVANEYMPVWVSEFPKDRAHTRLVFFQGKGSIQPKITTTQKINATVIAGEPSILQLNSIYYPGWGVAIDDQFSMPDYHNSYGLMRFPVSAGTHTFIAEFRETIPRFIADFVSILFVIVYFAYLFLLRTLHKKV